MKPSAALGQSRCPGFLGPAGMLWRESVLNGDLQRASSSCLLGDSSQRRHLLGKALKFSAPDLSQVRPPPPPPPHLPQAVTSTIPIGPQRLLF